MVPGIGIASTGTFPSLPIIFPRIHLGTKERTGPSPPVFALIIQQAGLGTGLNREAGVKRRVYTLLPSLYLASIATPNLRATRPYLQVGAEGNGRQIAATVTRASWRKEGES